MDQNGQIPKPTRVELGTKNLTDRHVKEILEHWKAMGVETVNIDEDAKNEEYTQAMQIEFYADESETSLLDKIEIPYEDTLTEEQRKQLGL